jgi:hypothetical protein
MCKEMPVIPVDRVVDKKRIIGKKWRAEEEERHEGSADPKKLTIGRKLMRWVFMVLLFRNLSPKLT